jgi:hypothetical protein
VKNLSRRREEYEENWLIIFFRRRKRKEENALSRQGDYSIFRSRLTIVWILKKITKKSR